MSKIKRTGKTNFGDMKRSDEFELITSSKRISRRSASKTHTNIFKMWCLLLLQLTLLTPGKVSTRRLNQVPTKLFGETLTKELKLFHDDAYKSYVFGGDFFQQVLNSFSSAGTTVPPKIVIDGSKKNETEVSKRFLGWRKNCAYKRLPKKCHRKQFGSKVVFLCKSDWKKMCSSLD